MDSDWIVLESVVSNWFVVESMNNDWLVVGRWIVII